ncbi:MAG: YraN family protein [Campylobacterota bacterium]|nr:YraN family protein [Campylobacterota bacterium]
MSRHKGQQAEKKASDYLQSLGFKIIQTNYYARKMGEIDIIASKDEVVHFIEVKSGSGFEAVYNITPSKINKILKSAYYYLKVNTLDCAFSIDAVIVQDEDIELIENITM